MERLLNKLMILIRGNRLRILELVADRSRRLLRAIELYKGQKFVSMIIPESLL